jgi:hypothetical protein
MIHNYETMRSYLKRGFSLPVHSLTVTEINNSAIYISLNKFVHDDSILEKNHIISLEPRVHS